MTRAQAKIAGLKRYHGKVCEKHPEINVEDNLRVVPALVNQEKSNKLLESLIGP